MILAKSSLRAFLFLLAIGLAAPITPAGELTFEERVRAQEAIERVYYGHQIGATRAFEEAVPGDVLEEKVRNYLKQSVALETYWSTPVTAAMLDREAQRIAQQTQMPERLREIFDALENDGFLVRECLARQTLANRLAHNFFASDSRIHETAERSWDAWWSETALALDGNLVGAVADEDAAVPEIPAEGGEACDPAGTWNNGSMDDVPDPRSRHTAVWTGSLKIIWGGAGSDGTGGRYDPITDTWESTSYKEEKRNTG